MEAHDQGPGGLSLYTNPRGLYRFQAEISALCYLRPRNLAVVDTGLGKTHIAQATIALLFEDNLIDRAIVVCEGNKVDEWMDDFAEFTSLRTLKYNGTRAARQKRLTKRMDEAQVVVVTYQTAREDIFVSKDHYAPDFFYRAFEGERLLVVYDEVTVLGGRTSRVHAAHKMFSLGLGARVLGLTATPVTNGPESYYNLGLIFCPDVMDDADEFYRKHAVRFNKFGEVAQWRDIEQLAEQMSSVLIRKRKTDPDVVDQFPRQVEDFIEIRLNDDHDELYRELEAMADQYGDDERTRYVHDLLCAFANHPRSIFSSNSALAREFMERHDPSEIEGLVCAKTESVIRKVSSILSQGDQVIVFCDSVAVLDELYSDMLRKKMAVERYHGQISERTREENKAAFKSGAVRVLLCSSAAERGINLPEASYVINYDVPTMHSTYVQRVARASRIGSRSGEILVAITYIAKGTAEEGSVRSWVKRNLQSDTLIDFDADDGFVSGGERKEMIKDARRKA